MPLEISVPASVRGRNPDVTTNHIPSLPPQEAYLLFKDFKVIILPSSPCDTGQAASSNVPLVRLSTAKIP